MMGEGVEKRQQAQLIDETESVLNRLPTLTAAQHSPDLPSQLVIVPFEAWEMGDQGEVAWR
jgi:hypothetical protein